eukprot:gene19915-23651_t
MCRVSAGCCQQRDVAQPNESTPPLAALRIRPQTESIMRRFKHSKKVLNNEPCELSTTTPHLPRPAAVRPPSSPSCVIPNRRRQQRPLSQLWLSHCNDEQRAETTTRTSAAATEVAKRTLNSWRHARVRSDLSEGSRPPMPGLIPLTIAVFVAFIPLVFGGWRKSHDKGLEYSSVPAVAFHRVGYHLLPNYTNPFMDIGNFSQLVSDNRVPYDCGGLEAEYSKVNVFGH